MSALLLLGLRTRLYVKLLLVVGIFFIGGLFAVWEGFVMLIKPRDMLEKPSEGIVGNWMRSIKNHPKESWNWRVQLIGVLTMGGGAVLAIICLVVGLAMLGIDPASASADEDEYELVSYSDDEEQYQDALLTTVNEVEQQPIAPVHTVEPVEAGDQYLKNASALWQQGNQQAAIESAHRALTVYEYHLGPNDPKTVNVRQMIQAATGQ